MRRRAAEGGERGRKRGKIIHSCPHSRPVFHRFIPSYPQVRAKGGELVKTKRGPFNPDLHRRQTQIRLVIGGFLILFVAGGGLVWLLYGLEAALAAETCLSAVSTVMGGLWLLLTLLERWIKAEDP